MAVDEKLKKSKISTARFLSFVSTCCLLSLTSLFTVLKPKPAQSAEKLYVSYGPLDLSLSVDSLETYAKSGKVDDELKFYARFIKSETLAQTRQLLQQRFDISQVAVSQFAYSPTGEMLLKRLGRVIQTKSGRDGFHALRSALILAAGDPNGLTVLNVMRRYPTYGIRINLPLLQEMRRELTSFFNYRDTSLVAIAKQMEVEAAAEPSVNFSSLPDARQPGPFRVSQRTLDLTNNRNRQSLLGEKIGRTFKVDLYLPEGQTRPAPVVVISHGLGSGRSGFAYLGKHLASHGFAVAIPEHIGSDYQRRQELLSGLLRSDINPVEFIDRPLDIKFLLDELERLSQSDPALTGRLNLQQVGAIGHSTGGYTALALAGAPINHARLNQECAGDQPSLNISVLLQCLADRLPAFNYNLRDDRIKAAIAVDPITSTILGPESLGDIQIPTMIVGGSNDTVAPAVPEQIHPFVWLKTAEKYLAIIVNSGHTFADESEGSPNPLANLGSVFSGPNPQLAREYLKALSLAFVQTHLGDRPEYRAFLSSAYAKAISQEPLKLELVRSLTPNQLQQAFGGPPPEPIFPKLATASVPRSRAVLEEIKKTGVLKVAIRKDAAPFGYVDGDGKSTGYCTNLLGMLANQLQQQLKTPVKLEIAMQSTLENRFEIVKNGTVQLECGPNTIKNDIKGVEFSTPFFITGTHFLVQKDNSGKVNPLSNLSGVSVGVLSRTTTEQFVQSRYPKTTKVYFQGPTGRAVGVQALANGNIDAFANDGILLIAEVIRQKLPLSNYALVPERPLTCDAYGMVLPANDKQWQNTVNAFIGTQQARKVWDTWFTNLYPYIFLNLDYCADR